MVVKHVQAARIGVFLELLIDQWRVISATIFGMHAEFAAIGFDFQRFVLRLQILCMLM